jgi:hypothetical protein
MCELKTSRKLYIYKAFSQYEHVHEPSDESSEKMFCHRRHNSKAIHHWDLQLDS